MEQIWNIWSPQYTSELVYFYKKKDIDMPILNPWMLYTFKFPLTAKVQKLGQYTILPS